MADTSSSVSGSSLNGRVTQAPVLQKLPGHEPAWIEQYNTILFRPNGRTFTEDGLVPIISELPRAVSNKLLVWNKCESVSNLLQSSTVNTISIKNNSYGSAFLIYCHVYKLPFVHSHHTVSISGLFHCKVNLLKKITGVHGPGCDKRWQIQHSCSALAEKSLIHPDEMKWITMDGFSEALRAQKNTMCKDMNIRDSNPLYILRMKYAVYLSNRVVQLTGQEFLTEQSSLDAESKRTFIEQFNNGNIEAEYKYMCEDNFWNFVFDINDILPCIVRLYNRGDSKSSLISLYNDGVLQFDVDLCKRNKSSITSDTAHDITRDTTRFETITMPRGIITTEHLLANGYSKFKIDKLYRRLQMKYYGSTNVEHKTLAYDTNKLLINKLERGETDLSQGHKFYDFDHQNRKSSFNDLPYHILSEILFEMNVVISGHGKDMVTKIIETMIEFRPSLLNQLNITYKNYCKAIQLNIHIYDEIISAEVSSRLLAIAISLAEKVNYNQLDVVQPDAAEPHSAVRDITMSDVPYTSEEEIFNQAQDSAIINSNVDNDQQLVLAFLARYPTTLNYETHKMLRSLNRVELYHLAFMLTRRTSDYMFWSRSDLLFLLARGYSAKESARTMLNPLGQRYSLIGKLNIDQLLMLCQLHNISYDENIVMKITQKTPNLLENMIIEEQYDKLAVSLGMLGRDVMWRSSETFKYDVCHSLRFIHRGSLKLHMLSKGNVLSMTNNNMEWFTEQEIYNTFGVYKPTQEMFYRPDFREIVNRQAFINKETVMLDSTTNLDMPMIGYGYLDNFIGFGLDELIACFESNKSFSNPCHNAIGYSSFSNIKEFSTSDMRKLIGVLTNIHERYVFDTENPRRAAYMITINKTINTIERLFRLHIKASDELKSKISDMKSIGSANLDEFKIWLKLLFDMGWYFRRWKGPGNSYPVRGGETHQEDNNPEKENETSKNLAVIMNNINVCYRKMSPELRRMIGTLKELTYDKNNNSFAIRVRNSSFVNLVNASMTDRICIRVASKSIIISTYGYLHSIFGKVRDFDIKYLDAIQ